MGYLLKRIKPNFQVYFNLVFKKNRNFCVNKVFHMLFSVAFLDANFVYARFV